MTKHTFSFTVSEDFFEGYMDEIDALDELEEAARTKFVMWLRIWRDMEYSKRNGKIKDYRIEGDDVFIVPIRSVDFIQLDVILDKEGPTFTEAKKDPDENA